MTAVETATQQSPRSIRSALLSGAEVLRQAGLENSRLDAEVLLGHAVAMEKEQLYINAAAPISTGEEVKFRDLLRRRSGREPVAYITGHKEFWSLDFVVTPAVLIPRPETELLVEVALQYTRRLPSESPVKVLDVGTGSGAISVCLAKERASTKIVALDISTGALDVARVNAERHDVVDRIRFLLGDAFAPIRQLGEAFNLIVANPPYIRSGELPQLAPEIRRWEPTIALNGGPDGLSVYRRIIAEGHEYLTAGGSMVLEIGADMAPDVADLFSRSGRYGPASVYQDYAGMDRVIAAVKLSTPFVASTSINRG